jgi:hypothetical protein
MSNHTHRLPKKTQQTHFRRNQANHNTARRVFDILRIPTYSNIPSTTNIPELATTSVSQYLREKSKQTCYLCDMVSTVEKCRACWSHRRSKIQIKHKKHIKSKTNQLP